MADALKKDTVAWVEPEPKLTDEDLAAKQKADAEEARNKYKIIDNARYELVENQFLYPFDKLDIGQGFFTPVGELNTLDKFVVAMSKQANQYRVQNSQIEKNDEGDDVLETVTINARLRNSDGSFKLDGDGIPKLGIATVIRPKLIGPMFIVKAIHKDDELADDVKAEEDGVLVIRVD